MTNNKKQNEQWMLLVLILKDVYEQKGLTQSQIAKNSGMHQSHVSRFFALKYAPNLDTFTKISKAIGVSVLFQDEKPTTDMDLAFEKAMQEFNKIIKDE